MRRSINLYYDGEYMDDWRHTGICKLISTDLNCCYYSTYYYYKQQNKLPNYIFISVACSWFYATSSNYSNSCISSKCSHSDCVLLVTTVFVLRPMTYLFLYFLIQLPLRAIAAVSDIVSRGIVI